MLYIYRSSICSYSTEEKPAESVSSDKQLPTSVEECHKQIEALTGEVASLKQKLQDYEVRLSAFSHVLVAG